MKTIIDALYDGNLDFIIGKDSVSREYMHAMKELTDIQNKLAAVLPEEYRYLVDKLSSASTAANVIECKQHFEKGYRLGAMLMLAVFTAPVNLEQ